VWRRLVRHLPWYCVTFDAMLLALGGLSTVLLDNHSGNWGGANGIFLVLVALPGILVLQITGILSLLTLINAESTWMMPLAVLTNLALAYAVGWGVQAIYLLDKNPAD